MSRAVEGMRFVVWPGPSSCRECLRERVEETDAFHFRTGSRLESVSPIRDNPFLARGSELARSCCFRDGVSIDRSSLYTRSAAVVCAHQHNELPSSEGEGYRVHTLEEFFARNGEESFVSPVHATIATAIDYSLDGLVTAKASGFLIKYARHGSYTQPWGGHCTSYRDATRLGMLEGIERIGAESGAPGQVLQGVPERTRTLEPHDFGVADSDWLIPNPTVRAWMLGRELDPTLPDLLGDEVAVPERLVLYRPLVDTDRWVQESSNGCAIGGNDSEAILFGLLEAIERDAFLIAWYCGLRLAPIALCSVTDDESRAHLQRLELCGVRVRFLDATCGLPIPVVIAIAQEPGGSICVGAGSSLDPERALRAALVEVASDFQVVAAHREQRGAQIRAMLNDYGRVRVMEDHADMFADPAARPLISHWLEPDLPEVPLASLACHTPDSHPGRSVRNGGEAGRSEAPAEPPGGLMAELRQVVEICRASGFAPVAVPTQAGLANSVGARCWKVVVPGLVPIDFGFDHQRALRMPRLEQAARHFGGIRADEAFNPNLVPHPFP